MAKPIIAVYDTKPYDRDYLTRAIGAEELDWHFHEFRLDRKTAFAATGNRKYGRDARTTL